MITGTVIKCAAQFKENVNSYLKFYKIVFLNYGGKQKSRVRKKSGNTGYIEFPKPLQFMYGGKVQKVTFKYNGPDIDAILDRLPTATIICEEDGFYTLKTEGFGKGIEMWLKSHKYINVEA